MARLIRRSEDVKEDLELEVNPFASVLKEEGYARTREFEVIKTMYSKEHFDRLHTNLFYMGEKKVIVDNFHKEPFRRWEYNMFVEYKSQYKYNIPIVSSVKEQKASRQTLEKIEGLLDLPNYIKRRIKDISFELNPKENFDKEIDLDKMGEIRRMVLELNMKRFIDNNTWVFKSRSKSLRIFCPFLSVRDSYFTMKFLVYKDGQFEPCIYMILLDKLANQLQKIIVEIDGEAYDFYIELKTPEASFGDDDFPNEIAYYDLDTKHTKTLPVDVDNPDDCVVVAMFMAGLLTQPDMTRYHNLFRDVRIDPVKMTLSHSLSYGGTRFIEKVMTQRVKSFYNRNNPSVPKKQIRSVSVILPLSGRRKLSGPQSVIKGYNAVYNRGEYWIQGYLDGNTKAQNEQYLTQVLNDLGCNHVNSVIPVAVIGHQLYMSYDGAAYHLHDPQVNEYIDDILKHSNHRFADPSDQYYDPDTIPHLSFFCIETSEPMQAMIAVPEMPLLYESTRLPHLYKDDLYPTVNQAVSYFSEREEFSFPDASRSLLSIQDDVVSHISILSMKNDLPLRDSIKRTTSILYDLQMMRFGALQHPSPSASIDKVYHIEKSLQRTFEQMSSFDGLRDLRLATSDYYKQNIDVIMKGVQGIFFGYIEEREVYDLLLSKPFFVGFQNFFLKEYPQDAKLFLDDLIEYIRSTNKPVLHLVHMFIEIRRMARAQGLEDQILSYLSYFDTIELKSLYDLAQRLIVKLSEVSGSQDQMTEVLFQTFVDYSTRFFQSPLPIGGPLPKVPKRELKYAIPGFLEQRPRYEIKDSREVSINALSIFIMLMNIVKYGSDLKNQYLGNK